MDSLNKRRVGRCGELLVQYMLLKQGIESASLTTDPGVDLVAFRDVRQKPVTIQVKTSTPPSDASGSKWVRWDVPANCPAEYVALVDLNRNKFWLISAEHLWNIAKRPRDKDCYLWWYVPEYETKRGRRPAMNEEQFKEYEMDAAISRLFSLE